MSAAKVIPFPLSDAMRTALETARFMDDDELRRRRESTDRARWRERLDASGLELDDDSRRAIVLDRCDDELPMRRVRSWYATRHPLNPDEPVTGPPWIFLCGPKGCGKSTAAGWVLARQWGLAATMTMLLADFQSWRRCKPFERHSSMFERYKRAGVLVLDEVGSEKDSDADLAREAVFALVNGRQSRRLDTLVLTNLSKEQLRERFVRGVYDERSHDRLRGIGVIVGFPNAPSLRRTLPGSGW